MKYDALTDIEYVRHYGLKERRLQTFLLGNGLNYQYGYNFKQRVLYFKFQSDYLMQEMLNLGYTPVFVTLTLPSPYHPTGSRSGVEYGSFSIEEGYKKLKDEFRELYKNFRVNRKYQSVKFIRVIEPHKTFVPHLHAILFVKDEHLQKFKTHFENIVSKNEIEQYDYRVLDNARYAITYLLKYVNKTLDGDESIRGWSLYHKIRQFSLSNVSKITFKTFKLLDKYIKFDREDSDTYLHQIEKKTNITVRYFLPNSEIPYRVKVHTSPTADFCLSVDYTVYSNPREYQFSHTKKIELLGEQFKIGKIVTGLEDVNKYYKLTNYSLQFENTTIDRKYFYSQDYQLPTFWYQDDTGQYQIEYF